MLRPAILVLLGSALGIAACGGATEGTKEPSSSSGGTSGGAGASSSGAPGSSGGGGVSSGGVACTDIGCSNGLQVDFTYRDRGSYLFEIEVDGVTVYCKASIPLPRGYTNACSSSAAQLGLVGSMLPESQQSIGGLMFGTSPSKVRIQAQRDGVILADTTMTPSYTVTPGPNGPGCEPKECRFGKASLP
jgi:hypothetical protein